MPGVALQNKIALRVGTSASKKQHARARPISQRRFLRGIWAAGFGCGDISWHHLRISKQGAIQDLSKGKGKNK